MRILLLAPHPFFQNRGTPIAVRALLEVLSSRGDEVEVLTYAEGEPVTIPHCTIRRIPRIPGLQSLRPGFSLKKLASDAVMLPIALARIRSGRFDLVHAVEESAFMAALGAMVFRTPYVYDMDSSLAQQMQDQFPFLTPIQRLMERAEGFAIRHSLAVVGVCQALVDAARRYSPETPAACVEDFSLLGPAAPPDERLADVIRSSGPIVLYVGNLQAYQGIDLLVESFAHAAPRTPAAQLVVIGGTPEHISHYAAQAAALGVANRVHLIGPRPVAALGLYLSQAAVVTSPRTKGQNTPMKIYSYLDGGTPLLATRLPTHTQVLDDEIAMLAPPEPQAFGDALVHLLEDAPLRAQLAAAARDRVRREFTRDAFRRKMTAFYAMVERELAAAAARKVA